MNLATAGRKTARKTAGGQNPEPLDLIEHCRQLEQRLHEAERRLDDYTSIASDWLWETDADGRFIAFSGRLSEVSGLDPRDLVGRTRQELMVGHSSAQEQHLEVLKARQPFRDFTYETMTPKGLRTFRISGKPCHDGQGRFAGYRGTGSDITAEVEANHRAHAIHARFVEAIENVPASLLLCDRDDRLVICNSITERYFPGLADMLVPGTPFEDLMRARAERGFIPDAIGQIDEWLARRMEIHRNPGAAMTQRYGDGRWAQITERRTSDGGIICIAVDITELKRQEDELAGKSALLQATLENIGQGLSVIDRNLTLAAFNDRFFDLLQFPKEFAEVGRPFADFIRFNAERGEYGPGDIEAQVAERVALAGNPRPHCFLRTRPDGTVIEVRGMPMPGGGFVTTYSDVTELKQAQQAAEADARRLAEAAEELQRSNRDLEQFAYVASHDLQEPLRMVGSYCQLLQRRYRGKLDADADEFIAFAVEGATRMQRMINDLLAYSRVGRGGKGMAPVSMQEATGLAIDNLRNAIADRNASIVFADLPAVMGEKSLLAQLMQNLIGNAIKFSGERPIEIGIDAEPAGDFWRFAVRDNGIGIEKQYAERIFMIFQRLHDRGKYPGTGIGLALCKKVVEHHGGRIWMESEPGQGTTFFFTLPANSAET